MSYVGSISHCIQVEGPSWPVICEYVQVMSPCLLILSLFVQCFSSVCVVGDFFRICLRSQFTYLLLQNTKIALTRRKRFKTA